jgi:hypothetical protein
MYPGTQHHFIRGLPRVPGLYYYCTNCIPSLCEVDIYNRDSTRMMRVIKNQYIIRELCQMHSTRSSSYLIKSRVFYCGCYYAASTFVLTRALI